MESRRVGTGRKGRLDATVEDDGGDGLSGYGSIHGMEAHFTSVQMKVGGERYKDVGSKY